MRNKNQLIQTAIMSMLTITTFSSLSWTTSALASDNQKCYGIVKAGMNDCQTTKQTCAGSATKDRQSDAFIFLPKGTCEKIVGGSLKSIPPSDN